MPARGEAFDAGCLVHVAAEKVGLYFILDDGLAHVEPDADQYRVELRMRGVELGEPLLDQERLFRGGGRLGEHRHDGVADILNDDPRAIFLDRVDEDPVVLAVEFMDVGLAFVFGQGGKALNIGEHDREDCGVILFAVLIDVREFPLGQVERRSERVFCHKAPHALCIALT